VRRDAVLQAVGSDREARPEDNNVRGVHNVDERAVLFAFGWFRFMMSGDAFRDRCREAPADRERLADFGVVCAEPFTLDLQVARGGVRIVRARGWLGDGLAAEIDIEGELERADFSFGSERYFPGEERALTLGVRATF